MTDIKELIKNFKAEDYFTKVDLHLHSCFSDGICTPEELVAQAKEKKLEYIAITDHNTLNAYLQTQILKEKIVIPAIEFDCWHKGVLIHIIGYGVEVNNKELFGYCAKTQRGTKADVARLFSYRDPKKVINAIKNAGGFAVLAHPACCWAICLDGFIKSLVDDGLEGVEVYYPYKRHRGIIKFHFVSTVKKIAEKYNLIQTGGTDEHGCLIK